MLRWQRLKKRLFFCVMRADLDFQSMKLEVSEIGGDLEQDWATVQNAVATTTGRGKLSKGVSSEILMRPPSNPKARPCQAVLRLF